MSLLFPVYGALSVAHLPPLVQLGFPMLDRFILPDDTQQQSKDVVPAKQSRKKIKMY
jgi:hypothetical protein